VCHLPTATFVCTPSLALSTSHSTSFTLNSSRKTANGVRTTGPFLLCLQRPTTPARHQHGRGSMSLLAWTPVRGGCYTDTSLHLMSFHAFTLTLIHTLTLTLTRSRSRSRSHSHTRTHSHSRAHAHLHTSIQRWVVSTPLDTIFDDMRSNLINATRDEAMFAARAQLIGTSATYVKTHVAFFMFVFSCLLLITSRRFFDVTTLHTIPMHQNPLVVSSMRHEGSTTSKHMLPFSCLFFHACFFRV
jgi:hypothetical protein